MCVLKFERNDSMKVSVEKIKLAFVGLATIIAQPASAQISLDLDAELTQYSRLLDFKESSIISIASSEAAFSAMSCTDTIKLEAITELEKELGDAYEKICEFDDPKESLSFSQDQLIKLIHSIDAVQRDVYSQLNSIKAGLGSYKTSPSHRLFLENLNASIVKISGHLKDIDLIAFDDMNYA